MEGEGEERQTGEIWGEREIKGQRERHGRGRKREGKGLAKTIPIADYFERLLRV